MLKQSRIMVLMFSSMPLKISVGIQLAKGIQISGYLVLNWFLQLSA